MLTYHVVLLVAFAGLCVDIAWAVNGTEKDTGIKRRLEFARFANDHATQESLPDGDHDSRSLRLLNFPGVERLRAEPVFSSLPFSHTPNSDPSQATVNMLNPWKTMRLKHVGALGDGGFGVVYKAIDTERLIDVAAKTITIDIENQNAFDHEVSMMRLIGQHDNVVQMYDVFAYDNQMCLTMEVLAGGDLFTLLEENGAFTMAASAAYLKTMATIVKELHDRNIVHNDLKMENFVFRHETKLPGDLVAIDFGMSQSYLPGSSDHFTLGTLGFIPRFRSERRCPLEHLKLSDSFALGRTLFGMSFAYYPDPNVPIRLQVNLITDPKLRDLLLHLTSDNPVDQLTADEILAHPFLQNTQDIRASMLIFNVNPFTTQQLSIIVSVEIGKMVVRDEQGITLLATLMHNNTVQSNQMISHELSVLKQCGSDPIVNFHQAYTYGNKLLVVRDMIHGRKLHEVVSGRKLSEKTAAKWFQRIVAAVAKLHDNGFTHGQLSLENFAFRFKNNEDPMGLVMQNVGNNGGSVKDDIFALGVILHTLVIGVQPFFGRDGTAYITSLKGLGVHVGNLLIDLIVKMNIDSCHDILNHLFMKKRLDTMKYYMDKFKRTLPISKCFTPAAPPALLDDEEVSECEF